MRKIFLLIFTATIFSTFAQSFSDGCMDIEIIALAAYNEEFEDPIGNDETNWRFWFSDVGNFDGAGFVGGNCIVQGGSFQIGFFNIVPDLTLFNHSYGTVGAFSATVPAGFALRGAFEGDDCGGSCDSNTSCLFDDDDYRYDEIMLNNFNYRFDVPNNPNPFFVETFIHGSSDFGGLFTVEYTSPRPLVSANTTQICAGVSTNVTFNFSGSIFGGRYVLVDVTNPASPVTVYNNTPNSVTLNINSSRSYQVYTSNGGVRSLCYSTISIGAVNCDFNCLSTTIPGGTVNAFSSPTDAVGGRSASTSFFNTNFLPNTYITDVNVPNTNGYSASLMELLHNSSATVSTSIVSLPSGPPSMLHLAANVPFSMVWDNPGGTTSAGSPTVEVCACKTANFGIARVNGSSSPITICENDPGTITLTHNGSSSSVDNDGYGDELRWFSGACGGTFIGSGMNVSIPSPTVSTTYYASFYVDGVPCRGANSYCAPITVNVTPNTVTGTLSPATQTICEGDAGASNYTLTGFTGTVTAWEIFNNTTGLWVPTGAPAGSTFSVLPYISFPGTYSFRAQITNGVCGTQPSASATLIVNELPNAGTVNAFNTAVCSDSSFVINANGFLGNIQWQVSSTNATSGFSNIVGQTSPSLVASISNASTGIIQRWYRVVASNAPCVSTDISNAVAISIAPETVPGTVTGLIDSICVSGNPGNLSLTGGFVGTVQNWLVSFNGGPYSNIVNTNTSYAPGALNTPGLYTYAAVVKSGGCEADTSGTFDVRVLPEITASISGLNEVCEGQSITLTASVAGGNGTYAYQWQRNGTNVGTNSSNLVVSTGLSAATYNYTVIVNSGPCQTTSSGFSITVHPRPVFSNVSTQNLSCYGVNIGQINMVASADSFSIDNGVSYSISNTFTGLAAGNYNLVAKNNFGCITPYPANPVTLTQPDSTLITLNLVQPNCATSNDGEIQVNATGGTPGYEYALNGGAYQSGNTFTALAPGNYTISVRDNNNCVYAENTTLTALYTFDLVIDSLKDVSCPGSADGYIDLGTLGGVPPFTYSTDNVIFTSNSVYANLVAGSYTFYALDGNGCSNVVSATIIESPPIQVQLDSVTAVSCAGADDAAIYVTISGSTTPYDIEWTLNGGLISTNEDIINVGPGAYNLTVTTSASCVENLSIVITEPNVLNANVVNTTNVSCNGLTNGSIQTSITGGTPGYSFEWIDASNATISTSQNLNGVGVGTYTLIVTDASGCVDSTSATTITAPAAISVVGVTTDPSCSNSNDGDITITVGGGTGPFTYSLNGGSNQPSNVFSGLSAGTYTLTVTDANGCIGTGNAILTNQYSLSLAVLSQTNVSCAGQNDGTVTLQETGGQAPFTYSINGGAGQASNVFAGLAPGLYNFAVSDVNGCSATTSATITSNPALSFTLDSVDQVLCNGQSTGAIYVSASGGSTPYSYSLNGGAGQATGSFTGLATGSYTITVSDASGCTENISTTITAPSTLSATVSGTVNVSCNGFTDGSIQVSVTGGTPSYGYVWTDAASATVSTNQNLSGVGAGTYTLTVTDANGCVAATNATTITAPAAISVVGVTTDPSCSNSNNGDITVTVGGGTGPFTYSLNGGSNQPSNVFSGLSAGTYTLTVTDANGCVGTGNAILTNQYSLSLAVLSQTNVSCAGQNDGTVTLQETGGQAPFTYSINGGPGQASNVFAGLAPGLYNFAVSDVNGCSATTSATITSNPALSFTLDSVDQVLCNGQSTGAIYVSASGGSTPYSYSLNGGAGQATGSFTGLATGSYTITVSDASGCTENISTTITAPSTLSATVSGTVNVSCNGFTDGSIQVSVTGGTPSYGYVWTDAASATVSTNQNLSGVGAGTYTLTVTDANGCVAATNATTITAPAAISVVGVTTDPSCSNSNNGDITVTVGGGTGPFTYSLNGGSNQPSNVFSGLSAGTYTLTVTDANGCVGTGNAILTNQYSLSLAVLSQTNVSCAGQNDGTVTLQETGGQAPFTYSINGGPGQASNVFAGLAPGLYNFAVSDVNGCSATTSTTITSNPALSFTLDSVDQVLCNGQSTGAIYVSASGGSTPYSYSLNGGAGQATGSFTGLATGSYTITVSDASGCTENISTTITAPSTLSATVSGTVNVSCNGFTDGSIQVSVTGGTPSYGYVWTDAASATVSTNQNLSGVGAGTYTLTVTDANGCVAAVTSSISQPTSIGISTSVSNPSCANSVNGTITITASGGTSPYLYALNNGASQSSNVFSGLSAGSYTITVTDANACSSSANTTLTNQYSLSLAVLSQTNVSCAGQNDGTVTLQETGGQAPFTYSINGGAGQASNVFAGLAPGLYNFAVSDVNGCSATTSATITSNPALSLIVDSVDQVLCNGQSTGAIYVSASGGSTPYSYSLNGGAGQATGSFTGLAAGSYTITVSDASGCTENVSASISEPAELALVIANYTDVLCFGDTNANIDVSVGGGVAPYTFSWSDGANTIGNTEDVENIGIGTYTVTVTDNNGCVQNISQSIVSPNALTGSITTTDELCFGDASGTAVANVSGGSAPYTYLWSTFENTDSIFGLSGGLVTVLVTDVNGCQITLFDTVGGPQQALAIELIKLTNVSCFGGNNGEIQTGIIGGTSPYTILWSATGDTTLTTSNLIAGSYTITVTDANGCVASESYTITQAPEIITSVSVTNPTCAGQETGEALIGASGGTPPFTYEWNTNPIQSGVLANNLSGDTSYLVSVTDSRGCVVFDTAVLVDPAEMEVFATAQGVTCVANDNGEVALVVNGGNAPYTYQLNGLIQTDSVFDNLAVGTYVAFVVDNNNCNANTQFDIVQNPVLEIDLQGAGNDGVYWSDDLYIIRGEEVDLFVDVLSFGIPLSQTSFSAPSSGNLDTTACGAPCLEPTMMPEEDLTVTVTALDTNGCVTTDTLRINVSQEAQFFMPSAFTPNGDCLNDNFEINVLGASNLDVRIYNRWGEELFHNPNQGNGLINPDDVEAECFSGLVNPRGAWDGNFNGQPMPNGAYTYQIDVTMFDGSTRSMSGTVTILR